MPQRERLQRESVMNNKGQTAVKLGKSQSVEGARVPCKESVGLLLPSVGD